MTAAKDAGGFERKLGSDGMLTIVQFGFREGLGAQTPRRLKGKLKGKGMKKRKMKAAIAAYWDKYQDCIACSKTTFVREYLAAYPIRESNGRRITLPQFAMFW